MARTNASFKLSKESKKLIATGTSKEHRTLIKKAFIDAELTAATAPKGRPPRDAAPKAA
jgi:hypothetical protein